jgi:hypothetical protein
MSLFVPHVFNTITKEKIASIFLRFGEITSIDLVPKKTGNKPHNAAYIRFSRWHDTMSNREFQQQLTSGAMKAHVTYDDKWYWIVLENKRVEKMATPLPETPVSSPKTPPRQKKPISVPGAPKKPPRKKFESLNQIARLHAEEDQTHIAQDLFGDDTNDLVDATYVYHMECEVQRLTYEVMRLKEMNMQLWMMRTF